MEIVVFETRLKERRTAHGVAAKFQLEHINVWDDGFDKVMQQMSY